MGRGSQGWVSWEVIVGQRPVGITTPAVGQETATSQSLRLLSVKWRNTTTHTGSPGEERT